MIRHSLDNNPENIINYSIDIDGTAKDPSVDVALDTIKLKKQAIIFVNSKRGAESTAEKIARKLDLEKEEIAELKEISEKALNVLSSPTKQCKRLALCLEKGIAFHHSGLASEQRKIIEQNFRNRKLKIIAATPTLAQGVDLPAYRTIIRDLKRFTSRGMRYIPVLEYEQQSGRAGRPGQEKLGQAICFAKNEKDKEIILEKYIHGEPESIISKLAVEPVLRMYVLSLISSQFCSSKLDLEEFFAKTFFAFQYGDLKELKLIVINTLKKLDSWKFIRTNEVHKENDDFISASQIKNQKEEKIMPTVLGTRVSELYLDPYTANFILNYLENNELNDLSLLFMFCNCIELKPLISARVKDTAETEAWLVENEDSLGKESELIEHDYFELLKAVRTTMFLNDWINEIKEDELLETYGVRPGEIKAKIDRLNWLVYSATEIAKLSNKDLVKYLIRLRIRVKNGCKEELIPLLRFKNIGRIRARKLFNNGIKNVHDVKTNSLETIAAILGKKIAMGIKSEVGETSSDEIQLHFE